MKQAKRIWYISELLGNGGGAFILYSLIAQFTEVWHPVEAVASFASAILTLIGTLLTAATVYFPTHSRPPWKHSRDFYARIVIGACIVAIIALCKIGTLPPVMINGFSMLAIAGALKRAIPYPQDHGLNTSEG